MSRKRMLMSVLTLPHPHAWMRSWWGLIFLNYAMEQLFQVLVVGLQAAYHDVVRLCELEECLGRPAGGDLHAMLATSIVVENQHAFKAQLVEKTVRVALNVQ